MRLLSRKFILFLAVFTANVAASSEISFEIRDHAVDQVIHSGSVEYSSRDVIETWYEYPDGEPVAEMEVPLDGGFTVGARIFSETKLTGFGIVGHRARTDFSWEWFELCSGETFNKLQGDAQVKVRLSGMPVFEILREIELLDDVLVEIQSYPGEGVTYSILLKAGSVLKFD